MRNKFKRAILQNFGLKVTAIVLAAIMWLAVVNIDDPNTSKTFTASVTVLNEDVLTAQGQYYTVVDNNYTVSFRVTAKRSIIEKLSNSDFTATADMNYLDGSRIPIEITANNYTSAITLSAKTYYLNVEIGNVQNNSFVIQGETTGEPADGYTAKSVTVTPNVVAVEGPDELVSQIDRIVAVADITGFRDDISETVVPTFYNKQGEVMDTTGLTLSVDAVTVSVDMCAEKTVPIQVTTSGTLDSTLSVESLTTDPGQVTILGESDLLSEITEIVVPDTVVDLSTITETTEMTVDVTAYLPDGVTLLDTSQNQVTITVTIGPKTVTNTILDSYNDISQSEDDAESQDDE